MPRYASARFHWSTQDSTYLLLIDNQSSIQTLTAAWLEQRSSFAFQGRAGLPYTVRKQRGQRGGDYWYAYRRLHGRVVKRYLGKTTELTFARLEEMALVLENMPRTSPETDAPGSRTTPPALVQTTPGKNARLPTSSDSVPLLFSKLLPPVLHPLLIDRSRLYPLLDAGCAGPLTLISAPAGFGKTTLVNQWLAARRSLPAFPPLAWLALEAADNDPIRFWRYLIAACQALPVDLRETLAALNSQAPHPPFWSASLENMLTTLLNTLSRGSTPGLLILEDYHAITAPGIHETFSFFLEHLPTTLHVILITRGDPPFPLARLRASHKLYEIRTADLRFSTEETTALLTWACPFPLPAATLQSLSSQFQGWGAGLHLAKLALQRAATLAEAAQALNLFFRHHVPIQEYFIAEVLNLQSGPVQQFLLQTSVLTRLTASLCDSVTAQNTGQEMLAQLEHLNLFFEPLTIAPRSASEEQPWYRYHALFAEALRGEARRRLGAEHLRQLAARASYWYEAHGYPDEAINAALESQDYPRAALLIAHSLDEQSFPGDIHEPGTLQRWLEQLPETLLTQQPVLGLAYATTLLFSSTSWLPDLATQRSLEKLLQNTEQVLRQENNRPMLGALFAFRALLALRQGDMSATITAAHQALTWLEPVQQVWRGLCLNFVAEEWLRQGRFSEACTALLEARTLCENAHNAFFLRISTLKLAQVYREQGQVQQATSLYRQALASAREAHHPYPLCESLSGMAELFYEMNDLASAEQYAQEARDHAHAQHLLPYEVHAALILARVRQAQDQQLVAQQQLADLLERVPASQSYLAQEIESALAHLALSIGDHVTIQRWASSRTPHADFAQEKGAELLLCRWLRAQNRQAEAAQQLESLLLSTQQAGHTRLVLEIQVEMVLLSAARKHSTEARQMLYTVLARAFNSNLVRLFLDAGEPMAFLLRSLLPQVHEQPLQTYLRALLSSFPLQPGTRTQAVPLIDALSPQEMRVLRLLVQHRTNAEIANELVVSVNTVRTQVQSIYNKLGVHTRGAASDVARELRLIS